MKEENEENSFDTSSDEYKFTELLKKGASMEDAAKMFDSKASSPDEAVKRLKSGNARFISGKTRTQLTALERRAQVAGQTPFAIILGCADSRSPTETIFDQSSGDLFTVRVAGNAVGVEVFASIEYAINHLKSHLVVVMGHEGCGAVKAAMLPADVRRGETENVQKLLEAINPAVKDLPEIRDEKAKMREATIANVRWQVKQLKENSAVKKAIESGQINVIGAFYEIGSGAVDFLETDKDLAI